MVGGSRTKRSPVWAHFTRKNDGGVCNLCQSFCVAKGGNTSNLLKHLRLKHNMHLKQCTIFDVLKKTPKDSDGNYD